MSVHVHRLIVPNSVGHGTQSERGSRLAARARTGEEIVRGEAFLGEVFTEWQRACRKFAGFHSAHEGYAVLLEEVDELWDEIKKREADPARMRAEAMQVAAMALRFVMDCCGEAGAEDVEAVRTCEICGAAFRGVQCERCGVVHEEE